MYTYQRELVITVYLLIVILIWAYELLVHIRATCFMHYLNQTYHALLFMPTTCSDHDLGTPLLSFCNWRAACCGHKIRMIRLTSYIRSIPVPTASICIKSLGYHTEKIHRFFVSANPAEKGFVYNLIYSLSLNDTKHDKILRFMHVRAFFGFLSSKVRKCIQGIRMENQDAKWGHKQIMGSMRYRWFPHGKLCFYNGIITFISNWVQYNIQNCCHKSYREYKGQYSRSRRILLCIEWYMNLIILIPRIFGTLHSVLQLLTINIIW